MDRGSAAVTPMPLNMSTFIIFSNPQQGLSNHLKIS